MSSQDTGPLDWRIGIVDKAGRPTPEFQRRWAIQRGNNELIGAITTGSGAPSNTPSPVEGQVYIDINTTPFTFYSAHDGSWEKVGVYDFTDLGDVPHAYTSHGDELVTVNSGATALVFTPLSSVLDLIDTTQGAVLYRNATDWVSLPPGTAGYVLATGGPSANPSWVVQSGGGGGGGATYTVPLAATFSWFDQFSGATKVDITGGLQLYAPSGGGSHELSFVSINTPSTPWTYWTRITPGDPTTLTNTSGFQWVGIACGDGTGKSIFLCWYTETNCQLHTYNSGNSINGATSITAQLPPLMGIQDDGTNLNFLGSWDGVTSYLLFTQSRTAWLGSGPTQIGVAINSYGYQTTANIAHFADHLPGPI